jgi:hypothetical protein
MVPQMNKKFFQKSTKFSNKKLPRKKNYPWSKNHHQKIFIIFLIV